MFTIPCFHDGPGKVNLSKQMACSSPLEHVCWVFDTDEEHRTVLVDFVKEGFKNNEKVVIITEVYTKEHLLEYFKDINIEKYILSGQLSFGRSEDVYCPPDVGFDTERVISSFVNEVNIALKEGYTRLRAYGDMSFAAKLEFNVFHQYESALGGFYAKHYQSIIGLCAYPSFIFDGSFITSMMTTHPKLYIGTEMFESNFYYIPDAHKKAMKTVAEYWISNLREHKALQHTLKQKNEDLSDLNLLLKGEVEERERAQTEKQVAEEGNRNKRAFIATLSHEIRTPLFGILSTAGLLRDTPLQTEQEEYVSMIDAIGEHLMTVLNDVLDYSKIELEQKPFSVRDCVNSVMEMFRKKKETNNRVAIEFRVSQNLPAFVTGDVTRLRQILLNLVGNALKFTPKGVVKINVDCEEANGKFQIYCSVQDNGIGIPKEQFGKIFTDYQQGDPSITRLFGGTGLGLAITKKLVEAMQGQIWFESELDVGTTFFFTIMVDPAKEVVPPPNRKRVFECPQSSSLRILVAEDNCVNQTIMDKMLKKLGHTITLVGTGQEAVEKVQEHSYDLVLMDLHMPVMGGLEATKLIRKMPNAPRIVAVTAACLEEERVQCEQAGMDGFLKKPLKIDDLHEVCQDSVDRSKHQKT